VLDVAGDGDWLIAELMQLVTFRIGSWLRRPIEAGFSESAFNSHAART